MKNRVVFRWMVAALVCAAAVVGIRFCRPARGETFSPLLADEFGVFLEISGKIRNEDRRTKVGEEIPLV